MPADGGFLSDFFPIMVFAPPAAASAITRFDLRAPGREPVEDVEDSAKA
ncbi:hypothetical protein [Streptomyces sp. NPDC006132]